MKVIDNNQKEASDKKEVAGVADGEDDQFVVHQYSHALTMVYLVAYNKDLDMN